MSQVYDNKFSTSMDNYLRAFPNIYYRALPSIISYDIKHKILELHFQNSVNTIISIWRKNIDKIRRISHIKWIRMIYDPSFENTDNIPLIRRQNAMTDLLM